MKRCLEDHPILLADTPANTSTPSDISFVIGHRGMERLPHLLATLRSIAAQSSVSLDCVVIEQDVESRIASMLPAWVRHVHTPPPSIEMPYCRSWAFNIGVKHCRSDVIVLHDNDMLVPIDYAASILSRVRQGCELINLKRFIFYLNKHHTTAVLRGNSDLLDNYPLAIVQNLEAGGSVAVTRAGFERICGMDESFIGWGGEDNEFWERGQTLCVWPYGNLPILHLWHAPQPEKHQLGSAGHARLQHLTNVSVGQRISHLRTEVRGAMSGPFGWKPVDCVESQFTSAQLAGVSGYEANT
ncbi:MAG TPA: galactosyltransferase-related protein [Blastocatellia bacterium]|nr:galactosyltransferase-related protein [Blastocatellia bacterium]